MSARRVSYLQQEQDADADLGDYNLDPIVQFNTLHASNHTIDLSSNSPPQFASHPQTSDQNGVGGANNYASAFYSPIGDYNRLSQPLQEYAQHQLLEWSFVDPMSSTPLGRQRSIPEQATGSTFGLSTPTTVSPAWSTPGLSSRQGHAHHRSTSSSTSSASSFTQLRTSYACPICYRSFTYPKDLRRHAVTHVPNHERPFLCRVDGCHYSVRGFSRRDALIRHARALHGMQSFSNH